MTEVSSPRNDGDYWLGEIPSHWDIAPLRREFRFEKGRDSQLLTATYIQEHPGTYPVYSGQTENDGIMGCIDHFKYEHAEAIFTTTVGARVMTPMLLSGRFSLSQNCLIMVPRSEAVSARFLLLSYSATVSTGTCEHPRPHAAIAASV